MACIEDIVCANPKYHRGAYYLIHEVLSYTQNLKNPRKKGHVSCRELVFGFRSYVRDQFGDIALFTLHKLNIFETKDIGEIVFTLIRCGFLAGQEGDRLEDFCDVYNFYEEFAPRHADQTA